MKNLSAAALTKIATTMGTEPITIIQVEWVRGSNTKSTYADRAIDGISGRILELPNLDNVINISGSSDSQEITIVLDDTDGTIKSIMDNNDIHLRDAWVYQWFEGLNLSDKFLLFKGKINSPIIWNEGDRTVIFTIISRLEDREIGFSPEEGNFSTISPELIGQPWPMCFGTTIHSKTLRLTDTHIGILGDGIGIADFTLPYRVGALLAILTYKYQCTAGINNPLGEALCRLASLNMLADPLYKQSLQLKADYRCQVETQRETFRVFDGELFPRGTINLKIGNATLEGHFENDTDVFRLHNLGGISPYAIAYPPEAWGYAKNHPEYYNFIGGNQRTLYLWRETISVPFFFQECKTPEENKQTKLYPYPEAAEAGSLQHLSGRVAGDSAGYIYLRPGTRVSLADNEEQKYVVSIVPGTVLRVTAWAQKEGQRYLQNLPEDYYSVDTETYGSVSAVIVTLNKALSQYEDMGWEDDIFVTFKSDVGPNTVDIIRYLIETYTTLGIDNTSFNSVKTKVDKYPSHFTIYDRKNILTVLQEISWQACCAIYLKDDVFYMTYLPEEPSSVATIGKTDMLVQSLELSHTDTEDIITKMICEWRASGIQENPSRTILRHNVSKYGTKQETYDFYIYNYVDAIIKNATFWLIRYSNTWKKVRFKTPLTKLNLETFDPVTLNLTGVLANSSVLTLIEKADYDSEDHSLIFECWTPVKAGEMTAYPLAFPANVAVTTMFPTADEIQEGFHGSGFGPNQESSGALPITFTARMYKVSFDEATQDPFNLEYTDEEKEEKGEEEKVNRAFSDQGNPTPSNIDDIKPVLKLPKPRYLGPDEPGPDSVNYEGVKTIDPDGWGNNYPGGPGSNLKEKDIKDSDAGKCDPNGLPDPDDLPPGECYFVVVVWYVDPVTMVRKSDGDWGTQEGDQGEIINGTLTPIEQQEIYVFNSCTAAQSFQSSMKAYAKSALAVVGQPHPYLVSGPYNGKKEEGKPFEILYAFDCPHPKCEETPDKKMVAFRPNGSEGGSGWEEFSEWAGEEEGETDGC